MIREPMTEECMPRPVALRACSLIAYYSRRVLRSFQRGTLMICKPMTEEEDTLQNWLCGDQGSALCHR